MMALQPAVINGKYSGLHKRIQDVAPHAYYVHCVSNNLNLLLKDAIKAVTKTCRFYDIIETIYNFFEHSKLLCCDKSFNISMIVIAQILH